MTNETVVVKGTAGDATPKDYVRMAETRLKNSEENAVLWHICQFTKTNMTTRHCIRSIQMLDF